jgi:hypothetical protein
MARGTQDLRELASMMPALDSSVADAPPRTSDGRRPYALLFGVQTFGAALLYWQGLPLYRKLLSDPASHNPQAATLAWVLCASVLIQVGYWTHHRALTAPPRYSNVLLGHVVLFVARMSFVLATAVFSFLFIANRLDSPMSITRYVVVLIGLFSLFCYTRELERLGKRLLSNPEKR